MTHALGHIGNINIHEFIHGTHDSESYMGVMRSLESQIVLEVVSTIIK